MRLTEWTIRLQLPPDERGNERSHDSGPFMSRWLAERTAANLSGSIRGALAVEVLSHEPGLGDGVARPFTPHVC